MTVWKCLQHLKWELNTPIYYGGSILIVKLPFLCIVERQLRSHMFKIGWNFRFLNRLRCRDLRFYTISVKDYLGNTWCVHMYWNALNDQLVNSMQFLYFTIFLFLIKLFLGRNLANIRYFWGGRSNEGEEGTFYVSFYVSFYVTDHCLVV